MKTFKLTTLFIMLLHLSCDVKENLEIMETSRVMETQSVVFITGADDDDNTFYKNARTHFLEQKLIIVEDVNSMEDIILWLNANSDEKNYGTIHIVSHSNAWRGISLKTCQDGRRITKQSLGEIDFPKPNKSITEHTDIIFHSCGLGANKELMMALKTILTSVKPPNLYASEYFNVFGGKFTSHYLAKPYYVFYPTSHSPGNRTLSIEIAHEYPDETLDWFSALETRKETEAGAVYSYRFNIPINWDIVFDDEENIPKLDSADDVMDFVLENEELSLAMYELGIPLEKFRWNSKIKNNILKIKGKTTVLCVLQPLMDLNVSTEYSTPDIRVSSLYNKF